MTPMPLGLSVKKLQSKVGLGKYDILFAYFVVEEKSKKTNIYSKTTECYKFFDIKNIKIGFLYL